MSSIQLEPNIFRLLGFSTCVDKPPYCLFADQPVNYQKSSKEVTIIQTITVHNFYEYLSKVYTGYKQVEESRMVAII